MNILEKLQKDLKELKLEKRQLLLSGKKTDNIDIKIKDIEKKIKGFEES